jgi:hypothetical protein
MNPEIKIIYIDQYDPKNITERTVTLNEILEEVGVEYGIADNAWRLTYKDSAIIKQVFINDKLVFDIEAKI